MTEQNDSPTPETDTEEHEGLMRGDPIPTRVVKAAFARKLEQERDEARGHCESIVEKARELLARWDQPSWKDTAPTAGFIYALRNAVNDYEGASK